MAMGMDVPDFLLGPVEGREERVPHHDDDVCIIRGENPARLVRGRIILPVADGPEPFAYTIWVSLSEKNYDRTIDLWDADERVNEPPYFGWLMNSIPNYPET